MKVLLFHYKRLLHEVLTLLHWKELNERETDRGKQTRQTEGVVGIFYKII